MMLLSLSLTGCGTSKTQISKPRIDLGPFPTVPTYSHSFYGCLTPGDKDLMLQREYDLFEWQKKARMLERSQ